ncbi:hypothetical protein [Falsiroseomonas sp. E2-1-a20]|uniref:hypothetical protein n=1 Tax=Falsiroseomonas sp. E2-1-a20 TaxID=3239300 RepID=UPI003F325958
MPDGNYAHYLGNYGHETELLLSDYYAGMLRVANPSVEIIHQMLASAVAHARVGDWTFYPPPENASQQGTLPLTPEIIAEIDAVRGRFDREHWIASTFVDWLDDTNAEWGREYPDHHTDRGEAVSRIGLHLPRYYERRFRELELDLAEVWGLILDETRRAERRGGSLWTKPPPDCTRVGYVDMGTPDADRIAAIRPPGMTISQWVSVVIIRRIDKVDRDERIRWGVPNNAPEGGGA